MYDTYIFDLYGTLVDIHTDEEDLAFWERIRLHFVDRNNNFSAEEIKEIYLNFISNEEFLLEEKAKICRPDENYDVEIDIANVIRKMYLMNGHTVREVEQIAENFRNESREYLRLYEGAEELLKELKAKGKRVILLSNAQALFTAPEIKELDIEKYFDKIYLSSDYGVRKPDQTFFELPYKDFNLDKKKTIMIGNDQTTDIAGAREFGYDTCYLHSNISPELIEPVKATFVQNPIDLTSLNKILMI